MGVNAAGDNVFVDPFLLVITLVMVLVLIFANIYFVAHYSHHADSFFGGSAACKAILVSVACTILAGGRLHHCGVPDSGDALGLRERPRDHEPAHHSHVVHHLHVIALLHHRHASFRALLHRDRRGKSICKWSSSYPVPSLGAFAQHSKSGSLRASLSRLVSSPCTPTCATAMCPPREALAKQLTLGQ